MDLSTPISKISKVGPILSKKFQKLGIETFGDLVYHVPSRYLDYSQTVKISDLKPGETVTVHAKIDSLKNIVSRRGLRMQVGSVSDKSGKVQVLWFNQPFLIKMLYPGKMVSLSGKVGFFNRRICLSSPDYELIDEEKETLHTGRLVPIYPETSGLSSKWIRRIIQTGIQDKDFKIEDFLPQKTKSEFGLLDLSKAINFVHFPKTLEDARQGRQRLAFNELLRLQLKSVMRKTNWQKNKAIRVASADNRLIDKFINSLRFELTSSQKKAVKEVLADMAKVIPMNRLLEGDVGSGKTVVAAAGMFAAFLNGYQSLIMAPTQILAEQHYGTLKKIFKPFNLRISLVTSSIKRTELGRSDIFVGTHALIHKGVDFDKVALAVIDEQHRFGVEQRRELIKKSGMPHVLTMTATPIPRTITLTTYGDLELSVLNEMPKGRREIRTWIVPEAKRNSAYDWISKQIVKNNSQAFIICPLIEDSQTETLADVKSVTSEYDKLKRIFPNLKLGLLHGRLKADEKGKILDNFKKGKINILVSTPVVEVGIDIPNASIMVIEASERFGLAQLHQLRGRVGRGNQKSYCLLFSNYSSGNAYRRLKAMEKSHSGFELAELDLKMRGPGEIFGTAQSGFPELKIASWNDYQTIKNTKDLAEYINKRPAEFPNIAQLMYVPEVGT